MESKIRVKMGEVEVEYEGAQEFLKTELPSILDAVFKLYEARGSTFAKVSAPPAPASNGSAERVNGERVNGERKGTTAAFAARLGAKTGPDLMLAAAGKLALVDSMDVFTREQLLAEMRTASTFYRESYRKNLTSYLTVMFRKDLNEVSAGKYSLTQSTRESLEKTLSGN